MAQHVGQSLPLKLPTNIFAPFVRDKVKNVLKTCGIELNGDAAYDLRINDERVYRRVLLRGSIGLGESYMDGWWDCDELDVFFTKLLVGLQETKQNEFSLMMRNCMGALTNYAKTKSFHVGKVHYDIGNSFYKSMLDPWMMYSCGYWRYAKTLEQAQEAKLELICRKLDLRPGQKVLDIGCGWGGFAQYAASNYGVHVTGITISRQQEIMARKRNEGLSVDIRLMDYHNVHGQFDRVVSIGMFEHVGYKNYKEYMEIARRCLTPDGVFLLHTIGSLRSSKASDPWITKYIFPHSLLPSMQQITRAVEGRFVIEDVHNFGADYDMTLMAWYRNFEDHWPRFRQQYGERFYRMWRYYLLLCAALFRARRTQLWQFVMTKHGIPGGYIAPR